MFDPSFETYPLVRFAFSIIWTSGNCSSSAVFDTLN